MPRQSTTEERMVNDEIKRLQKVAEGPPRPAPGYDITGMPPIEQLATYEEQANPRFSPRRCRWRDVQDLDAKVSDHERRAGAVVEKMNDVRGHIANADQADSNALAEWLAGNGEADRPALTKPALEARLHELETEHNAYRKLLDQALREKHQYVSKHRPRLAKLARRYVEAEQAKARRLLDEYRAVRDELAAAREAELWALTYGAEAATRMPDSRLLCGARKQPLQVAGINAQVSATRVLDAFVDDVDWLGRMATPEQAKALEGERAPDLRRGDAVWEQTEEGKAALRQEKQRQREEYTAAWGREPGW